MAETKKNKAEYYAMLDEMLAPPATRSPNTLIERLKSVARRRVTPRS